MLDPIHHQGLRLALGAFRTSPSESLLAEANEPSFYNRRLKLSMQYALKLKSNPSNPTYETVFEQQYKTLFENKPNMIPSFGIRISSEFENMNLDLDNIADYKISDVPPWTFTQPRVLFSLHNDRKSQTDHIVFQTKFHELLSYFPNYETIFTDGSKDGDTAGSACVTPSDTYKCRLPDNASIFSAEIKAIDLALDHIEQSRSSDFIIFSDSLSVLQSLHNRNIENPLLLDVDGTPIPVVEENKFLGVIFDRKLSFIPHIKQLKAKCQKALNLLRVVAHTDWGADRKVLLNLYRTIIRFKLDYGSIIYGSARKSYLEMLDPINHQGLRLALGAFRTSPSESLLAEANEPSLYNRRLKLSMQYALKLKSKPSNPTYETVFEPQYKTLFENKPNMIPSFGIRISSEFENMNLDLDNIAEFEVPYVPPWTFSQPRVLFSLHNDKKSQTDPLVFRTKYHELLSNFPSYETIFTDGSKDGDTAGSACVTPSDTYKCRLPDYVSVFSAEIKAIDLALDHIEQSRTSDFIIFSDSLAVLQSLHDRHIENPLLLDVLLKHNELAELNRIVFCWLPSHVGIKGNEKADIAAKSA